MYLDDFPELAHARLLRKRSRGVPIREGGRASAIAWMADGSIVSADTIVRFDVAEGEKPLRRLADAFLQTNAGAILYFGGDDVVRGAIQSLELDVHVDGAAFIFRRAPALAHRVTFRESSMRDSFLLGEMAREAGAAMDHPAALVAEIERDGVGVIVRDDIDENWTEVRVAVHQAHRGHGYGASIVATFADLIEREEGRLVCAGMHTADERVRVMLERGGFRLVDYYFAAAKRVR